MKRRSETRWRQALTVALDHEEMKEVKRLRKQVACQKVALQKYNRCEDALCELRDLFIQGGGFQAPVLAYEFDRILRKLDVDQFCLCWPDEEPHSDAWKIGRRMSNHDNTCQYMENQAKPRLCNLIKKRYILPLDFFEPVKHSLFSLA